MLLETLIFTLVWWGHDLGLLLYLIYVISTGLNEEKKNLACLLIFAKLSQDIVHIVPNQLYIISFAVMHIVVFFMYWFIYNSENKFKPLMVGITCLSLIPNTYNPYRIHKVRLAIRLLVYTIIVTRLKKQKQLPISKYIMWGWILFTHEFSWIFIPFQIVYDTYNYKIDITV
jgi:hypothetical protein